MPLALAASYVVLAIAANPVSEGQAGCEAVHGSTQQQLESFEG